MRGEVRRHRGWSRAVAALALSGLLSGQGHAMALSIPHPGDTKTALVVCAAQREPLLALQKEYTDIRRAKLTSTFASSAKAGLAMLFAGNPLFNLASNVAKQTGVMGQPKVTPMPGDPTGALTEALSLNIPGVGPPPAGQQASLLTALSGQTAQLNPADARTAQALSIVAAIGGSTDIYIKIKQQQLSNDPKRIALAIDSDAGTQVPVGAQSAQQLKALADCREHQVADYNAKFAAAGEKERKQLIAHSQAGLKSALTADADLGYDLVAQQATIIRVFTQGRAMAEGKSEADILAPQPAVYSTETSRQIWKMPPPDLLPGQAPPPPPKPTYVVLRPTVLRAHPDPKAAVVMNLSSGHSLMPVGRASADVAWWEVDVAGTLAYVPGADLGEPGAALDPPPAPPPVKGKGRGRAKSSAPAAPPPPPAGPPPLAPPSNIRALNGQVLAGRASDADRLKTLAANAETAGL